MYPRRLAEMSKKPETQRRTIMSETPEKYTLTRGQKFYICIKRVIDIVLAFVGMVVLLPVSFAIWIAIKIEDGWKANVFFDQRRIGLRKKEFNLFKFRSMKMDAPHEVATHLLKDPEQYVTRVGRFIRKTSIDELPQLFNILKGDMSFCGPRPALWNQYDLIELREQYGVHEIKPGLTGWAQIHGRDELEIPEKVRQDVYYLRHLSLGLDIRVFFMTVVAVLKRDGNSG